MAEFPEVATLIDLGWLSWPAAIDFGPNYIQHLKTDRTADLPLQVTLNKGKQSHKGDKEGVERKRVKLHLGASFSLQLPAKDVVKLAHQLQPQAEAAAEVQTAIKQAEAQHQLLLSEAGKQAEFKRHFMAQLTRGALRGAGSQGTAYSELIGRVVDAASAQLDQKLLTAIAKSK